MNCRSTTVIALPFLPMEPSWPLLAISRMKSAFGDPTTGKERSPIKNRVYHVSSLAFSPDGKTLATAGGSRAIRLWDVKTGEESPQFAGHWNSVLCVAFSPDGMTLASRSSDTTVRLWSLPSGKCRKTLSYGQYLSAHPNVGDAVNSLAFSSDGGKLIGLGGHEPSHDYAFLVWDVNSGERAVEFNKCAWIWLVDRDRLPGARR